MKFPSKLRIAPPGGAWAEIPGVRLTDVSDPFPAVKTDIAEIAGGVDIDLSTAMTGGIPVYKNRSPVVSCVVSRAWLWDQANAILAPLHGHERLVGLVGESWWWRGRISVSDPRQVGRGVLFSLTMDAFPYRLFGTGSRSVTPTTGGVGVQLPAVPVGGMPLVPVCSSSSVPVVLSRSGVSVPIPVGAPRPVYELAVMPGEGARTWTVKGDGGTLLVEWEEGRL